jgi:hypothetical protein
MLHLPRPSRIGHRILLRLLPARQPEFELLAYLFNYTFNLSETSIEHCVKVFTSSQ